MNEERLDPLTCGYANARNMHPKCPCGENVVLTVDAC